MESLKKDKTYEQSYYEKIVYDIFMVEMEIALQEERLAEVQKLRSVSEIEMRRYEKLSQESHLRLEELKKEMKENFDTDYDLEF